MFTFAIPSTKLLLRSIRLLIKIWFECPYSILPFFCTDTALHQHRLQKQKLPAAKNELSFTPFQVLILSEVGVN